MMFLKYLGRELRQRRRQTLLVALGLGLAIALVITVTSVTAGIGKAQKEVLASVYGVGTDITVSAQPQRPEEGGAGRPQRFDFDSDTESGGRDGESQPRRFAQNQVRVAGGTLDATVAETIAGIDGVVAVGGSLTLTSTSFDGEIPDFGSGARPAPGEGGQPGSGGPGSGGTFSVTSIQVEGVDLGSSVGPLSTVTLAEGRALADSDTGAYVALVNADYATENDVALDSTVAVGGKDFTVVGIVTAGSAAAGDLYVPLDTAQTLAEQAGKIGTLYVQAASADRIGEVGAAIGAALPDATVNTAEELAENVSGSLGSASDLAGKLGTWLAVLVLVAAFALAVLFTLSGVGRRVREFGTLKALGWRSRRIVGQVMGESVVQGLVGGVIGLVAGLGAVLAINLVAPELSASIQAAQSGPGGGGFPGGGFPGGGFPGGGFPGPGSGGPEQVAETATTVAITLQASVTPVTVLLAVALAIVGGVLAGAVGGWRASRMRPAEALRNVA